MFSVSFVKRGDEQNIYHQNENSLSRSSSVSIKVEMELLARAFCEVQKQNKYAFWITPNISSITYFTSPHINNNGCFVIGVEEQTIMDPVLIFY